MAKTNPLIAAYRRKLAERDSLDREIKELDMTLPEGQNEQTFDFLAEKRQQIEQEIRQMQEKVQLLTAWGKFKEGGPWSEQLRAELDQMDKQIGDIATGEAPAAAEAEAPAPPPTAEQPPTEEAPPQGDQPGASPAGTPPPDQSMAAAPPAVQASKKNDYQIQGKKGSSGPTTSERGTKMATEKSLKEKLADAKATREAIVREAKTRVAAAWTIAKTMLPTAPLEAQKAFAGSLLANRTSALKAALRQTAKNAHYTKIAETFKEVHKVEMNDLLEDPSVLNKEKSAVKSEVKGEAVNASKTADDRKDAGPQTPTYNDGRGHGGGPASEPKETDAGKAAERPGAGSRPGDTVDLSAGKSASGEKTAAHPAGCDCAFCKNKGSFGKGEDKKEEKKEAGAKKTAQPLPAEGAMPPAAPTGDEMPPAEGAMPPAEGLPPTDAMPPAEGAMPAEGAGDTVTETKIEELVEKADELAQEIHQLEAEISDEEKEGEEVPEGILETEGDELEAIGEEAEGEGKELEAEAEGQELNLDQIFDEGNMEEKTSALANEGDMSGTEFFAPTSSAELEASLNDNGVQEFGDVVASMFSVAGSDADPLAELMGARTAAKIEGFDILPSFDGTAATHFEQQETKTDDRDNESDHKDDLWAEVITVSKDGEEFKDSSTGKGEVRVPQDSVPKLETPKPGEAPESKGKAAAKTAAPAPRKPATLRKIKPVTASDKDAQPKTVNIAAALFNDGDDF